MGDLVQTTSEQDTPAEVVGRQIRMARTGLRMSIAQLAVSARVSVNTVRRIEAGTPGLYTNVERLLSALVLRGAEFLPDGGVTIRTNRNA